MNKVACVYAITNLNNGKRYIGSTVDFNKRIKQHVNLLNSGSHHNLHLQRAWKIHGLSAFAFGILSKLELDSDAVSSEQVWLESYRPEYNICPVAGSSLGVKRSEETKGRMSAAQKGRKCPELSKLNKSRAGMKLSDSHRRAMSVAHSGRRPSEATRLKMSESAKKRINGAKLRK